jgi:VIT1/CCC1 family predicted Fe2+/Mn2+ transporter
MVTVAEVDNHADEKLGNVHHTVQEATQDSEHGLDYPSAIKSEDSIVDIDFQQDVQDIEAVTIRWSKTALIVPYALSWFIYFVQNLVAGVSGALLPYVTLAFANHSLTPTTFILSSVIGGVTNVSIGKGS